MYFSSYSKIHEGKELSNFFSAVFPLTLQCGTFTFSSAEAAYQCLKQPRLTKAKVALFQVMTPSTAKQYGQTIPLRADWEHVKIAAMQYVLEAKFTNQSMRTALLNTNDEPLIHLSPWDRYWGVDNMGNGENHLGRLLMDLRERIQT